MLLGTLARLPGMRGLSMIGVVAAVVSGGLDEPAAGYG
jgi:hypothetical protein